MAIGLGLREWGPAELRAGLLGAAGLTPRASHETAVADWFSERFGLPALVVNSGSSALTLSLELLAQRNPDRAEVVMPALACPALTRVALVSGLKARYADIAPNLNTPVESLQRCVGPKTLAVVMVHAYGHPADSVGIQNLCREHGVALIDDAAQRIEPTSTLGTGGDFGVFSFAQSKNVVCGIDGSGGVLLIRSQRDLAALRQRWQGLPIARHRRLALLEFLLSPGFASPAYYVSRWRKRYFPVTLGPARIGSVDAAIALAQMASLPQRRSRRQELLQEYQLALGKFGVDAPQLTTATIPDYLARLMVRVAPSQREDCRKALAAQGISSRLPYRLPATIDEKTVPQATRSAAELLELPLPYHWDANEIVRVAETVAPFAASGTIHPNAFNGVLACNTIGN